MLFLLVADWIISILVSLILSSGLKPSPSKFSGILLIPSWFFLYATVGVIL